MRRLTASVGPLDRRVSWQARISARRRERAPLRRPSSATSPFLAPKAADAVPVAGLGHVPGGGRVAERLFGEVGGGGFGVGVAEAEAFSHPLVAAGAETLVAAEKQPPGCGRGGLLCGLGARGSRSWARLGASSIARSADRTAWKRRLDPDGAAESSVLEYPAWGPGRRHGDLLQPVSGPGGQPAGDRGRGPSPSHVQELASIPGVDEPRSRTRCDDAATPPGTGFSSMPNAVTSSSRPRGRPPRACRDRQRRSSQTAQPTGKARAA